MSEAAAPKGLTLGELRAAGRKLHAYCTDDCGHERDLDLARIALPANLAVAEAGGRLKCRECGGKRIYTLPADGEAEAGTRKPEAGKAK